MFRDLGELRRANQRAGGKFFDPSHNAGSSKDEHVVLMHGRFVLVHKRHEDYSTGHVADSFCLYEASPDGRIKAVGDGLVESWNHGVDLANRLNEASQPAGQ